MMRTRNLEASAPSERCKLRLHTTEAPRPPDYQSRRAVPVSNEQSIHGCDLGHRHPPVSV